jgi:hypothetical protein
MTGTICAGVTPRIGAEIAVVTAAAIVAATAPGIGPETVQATAPETVQATAPETVQATAEPVRPLLIAAARRGRVRPPLIAVRVHRHAIRARSTARTGAERRPARLRTAAMRAGSR